MISASNGENGSTQSLQGSVGAQYRALLHRNITLKKRDRRKTITEFAMPLYLILVLAVIRFLLPDQTYEAISQPHDGATLPNTTTLFDQVLHVAPSTNQTKLVVERLARIANLGRSPTYFETEADILDYNNAYKNVTVAIIFTDDPISDPAYKIRMDLTVYSLPSTNNLYTSGWQCRDTVPLGTLENEISCPPNAYFHSGFLTLQLAVDAAIISINSTERGTWPSVMLQSLPLNEFTSGGTTVLRSIVPLYMVFAWAQFIVYMLILIVEEKEKRIKEGMKMMGLRMSVYWLSWVSVYFMYVVLLAIMCTIILPLAQVFKNANLLLLFVLFILYGLSSIMLALVFTPFFDKAKMAGIVGQLVQVAMSLLFYLQVYLADSISTGAFYLLGLLSPCAFSMAIDKALVLDLYDGGLSWDNVWSGDGLPYAGSLIMISVDIVLYLSLAFYLDNVVPSEYGTKQKPWFIFSASFWLGKRHQDAEQGPNSFDGVTNEMLEDDPVSSASPGDVEAIPGELRGKEAIWIRGLRKVFKSRGKEDVHAVDGISLDIYEGEITAILGHNGAGKTTLFNLLTGMMEMSGGSAHIFGYNIKNQVDLDCVRRMTGVCPQHDILFSKLTPREHLAFFALIRGIPKERVEQEVNVMLSDVDLGSKADTIAEELSGGQKRKLSIGIALIGDPKLIFLDEPTAGVDAYSRRHLWRLLKDRRQGKVILLTTHFMDEADILSDRKAIVSKGRLRCCGTSLFLKSRFGIGYHLTLVIGDNGTAEAVATLVRGVVPDAELARVYGKEASLILPTHSAHLFPSLFRKLDAAAISLEADSSLQIASYGISMTTLEEVFLTLNKQEEEVEGGGGTSSMGDLAKKLIRRESSASQSFSGAQQDGRHAGQQEEEGSPGQEGFRFEEVEVRPSRLRSFKALLKMRSINVAREPTAVVFLVIVPLAFVGVGIGLVNSATISAPNEDPVVFKPALYLGDSDESVIYNATAHALTPLDATLGDAGLETSLFNGSYDFLFLRQPHFAAFQVFEFEPRNVQVKLQYNTSFLHTLPILVNLLSNSLLRGVTDAPNHIEAASHPLPLLEDASVEFDFSAYFAPVMIGFVFTLIPAGLVMDIVQDREMKGRNLLRLNGVGFNQYFASYLVVIGFLYFISYVGLLLIIQAFQVASLVEPHAYATTAFLYFLYMPGAILFTCCASYLFDKQETARQFYPSIATTVGYVAYTVVFLVDVLVTDGSSVATPLHVVFSVVVPYYVPFGVLYYVTKVYTTCSLLNDCADLTMADYLTLELAFVYVVCVINVPVYYVLLRVVDTKKLGGRVRDALWMKNKMAAAEVSLTEPSEMRFAKEDSDVRAECRGVYDRLVPDAVSGDASPAVIYDLGKSYKVKHRVKDHLKGGRKSASELVAVKNLSLEVRSGEVFGLLGPNGAGKTTTLRIMTAEEAPSRGLVQLCGYDITSSMSGAFANLGYCPQHDCLWPNLTVKEHIQCFAEIGGVREDQVKSLTDAYINGLQISDHRSKKSKACSGGTKRKLSYILSMMGRPKIVLLDEPSTGMDPQSKRFLWNSILASFKGGYSAILTTHSMEEADALCGRIGILVKGELRCLGSVQHLKNKYGSGYSLEVKLSRGASAPSTMRGLMEASFANAAVDEEFEERMVFKIPQRDILSLESIFTLLEKAKGDGVVQEYALSQTTLEQVFLRFAREQEEDESPAPPTAFSG